MNQSTTKSIIHQEIALDSYLNTLLEKIPATDDELAQESLPPEIAVEKNRDNPFKKLNQGLVEKPVGHDSKARTASNQVKPLVVMPDWSQQEFQAMFFRVGKLVLGTPLTLLLRTTAFTHNLTKIPGQANWFLGLIEDQDKKIAVLDTGQLIVGKTLGSKTDPSQNHFSSLILTLNGDWGLACDEVLSIGKVVPENVRWRTHRRNKPWLIGTVIDELTAIIDINELAPNRREKQ